MNEFNPGDGWREIPHLGDQELPKDCVAYLQPEGGWRYWIREVPVPPLPAVPNSVIEATWRNGEVLRIWLVSGSGVGALWVDSGGRPVATSGVTGFEVLAEPRAVTAQAVLDRIRALTAPAELRVGMIPVLVQVADEFGVES